ncbi:MAG: adenosylcobinamide-GDP ribazoletransferase [Candidatus Sericytochromatia bacterium]|nr:adenosylcobinamide-GDP ribazoletransferase [Candidatus Sericytochromatia bacterium]
MAFIFLTRVPVKVSGDIAPADIAAASRYYPLVGAGVGLVLAYLLLLALQFFPPLLAATLAALGAAVLTGAFHEDALGDVADAFGGGFTVARKLEIMKDSRLGTYGVLALVGAFLVRIQTLALLPTGLLLGALVAVHAASRLGIVFMLWRSPRARTEGLGADTAGLSWREPLIATLLALGAAFFGVGWELGLLVLAAAALASWGVAAYARAQVGGVTGDVLGAAQQVAELVALLVLIAYWGLDGAGFAL